jgi:hypothetical protein
VSGNIVGTAVTLEFVPQYGNTVRLVTNQLPTNGSFKWSGPIPNYSFIPANSVVRAYTNRLIHVDATAPACTPPKAVTLAPVTSDNCHQLWSLDGKSYGNNSGSCVPMNSIDQTSAFQATKAFCQAQGLPWFDFNTDGANFASSSLVTTCRRAPLPGDTYYNANFNTFMNGVMNNPSQFAQLQTATQTQQIVDIATTNGYTLSISDITFTPPPPDRHAHPQSACGQAGLEPCETHDCVTVYFPFNFCCIAEATSCSSQAVAQCNDGFYQDSFGHCAPANATLSQVIQAGCRTTGEIQTAYNDLKNNVPLGTVTSTELGKFSPASKSEWVTTLDVTNSKTCAFRAIASSKEKNALQAGYTISKAQVKVNGYAGNTNQIQDFWTSNGPQISPAANRSQSALALQMLATQSSAQPLSQYSSVALDYQTAASFGDNVYAFYVNPHSPVLGLQSCTLKGEMQYQIPSGTPISSLHRNLNGNGWEKYDSSTQTWVKTTKSSSAFLQDCLPN